MKYATHRKSDGSHERLYTPPQRRYKLTWDNDRLKRNKLNAEVTKELKIPQTN